MALAFASALAGADLKRFDLGFSSDEEEAEAEADDDDDETNTPLSELFWDEEPPPDPWKPQTFAIKELVG